MFSFTKAFNECLRVSKHKNIKQFCEVSGISAPFISALKKDSPQTKLVSLALVADCFGVKLSEFIRIGECDV